VEAMAALIQIYCNPRATRRLSESRSDARYFSAFWVVGLPQYLVRQTDATVSSDGILSFHSCSTHATTPTVPSKASPIATRGLREVSNPRTATTLSGSSIIPLDSSSNFTRPLYW
jgi:hypothetical protein